MYSLSKTIAIFVALMLLAACSQTQREEVAVNESVVDYDLLLTLPEQPPGFGEQVRPILERRCVVCHGCYDAPCQLKLSSYEGVMRGASKDRVYDGSRIAAVQPTRLMVDAQTTAEWRELGFHPVLADAGAQATASLTGRGAADVPKSAVTLDTVAEQPAATDSPVRRLEESVMYRMLRQKQRHPQQRVGMLPKSVDVSLNRKQVCPTLDEFPAYRERHSGGGMPFGLPNLEDDQYRTLVQWIAEGSPGPEPLVIPPASQARLQAWEDFFNGRSLKQQLVSRYLYEHLFQGHLHLKGTDNREFYRLVRSTTPSGTAIVEVKSLRPYDNPAASFANKPSDKTGDEQSVPPFYYRLRSYHPSIVAKNHVVYELSPERMQRYRALFLDADYEVTELPGYDLKTASNPFKAFAAIPTDSRYRFLLDDARFFIEGFIKGPVCRGQIALNVIEDRFWVVFFDPQVDLAVQRPEFLDEMADYLQLPSAEGDHLALFKVWREYSRRQRGYMKAKDAFFKQIHSVDLDHAMEAIWDGDGDNRSAALTVFRHLDSASVAYGLVGDFPETAWVLDYAALERIHYLLVAGFNVYGNLGHQLNTRLYMDFLRMEGEDYFLAFLPTADRQRIRASWYQGIREDLELFNDMDWLSSESVVGYRSDDPQRELYQHIAGHLGPVAEGNDHLANCAAGACDRQAVSAARERADAAMATVAARSGEQLRVFADISFLRVRVGGGQPDLAYTLIRNKGYKHVSSMFASENLAQAIDLDSDSLTVVPWLEGSYPNFFFALDLEDIEDFGQRYREVSNREDYERFVGLYGVRRTNQRFWEHADWFQDQYLREQPLAAGLFDFNRYQNR